MFLHYDCFTLDIMGSKQNIYLNHCFFFPASFIVFAVVHSHVQGHYAVKLLRHESILMNYSTPTLMASYCNAVPSLKCI